MPDASKNCLICLKSIMNVPLEGCGKMRLPYKTTHILVISFGAIGAIFSNLQIFSSQKLLRGKKRSSYTLFQASLGQRIERGTVGKCENFCANKNPSI
jgi:hypothetical protein